MWMGLEIVTLSKVSQTEKEKYHMVSLYMWNLKKWYRWTYVQNKLSNSLTWLKNKKVYSEVLSLIPVPIWLLSLKTVAHFLNLFPESAYDATRR